MMRSPAHHARVHPRQIGVVPVGPAAMPQGAPASSHSVYLADGGAMTFSAAPTATRFVVDTTAIIQTPVFPSALPRTTIHSSPSQISVVQTVNGTSSMTSSAAPTAGLNSNDTLPPIQLDPFQQVYTGMTLKTLHSAPPWVLKGAVGGAIFMVLLAAYCYICRWYYKRLPRSTARWDVDDKAAKELVYGNQPHYSPREEKQVEDDRRGVAVGDSYFPQGETWRKFEGRTARHPESFIYTGDHPLASPGTPPGTGATPNSGSDLARPRPRFVNVHRGHVDSVFSTISFPTTHRAESIRDSDFYPDDFEPFEHDGEIWDLASPGFTAHRGSLDSTARSASVNRASVSMGRGSMSVNRASIFGEASARARGSIVVYDSTPFNLARTSAPVLDQDPFAGPIEGGGSAYVYPVEKYTSKKSYDGGKKSMDGLHMRTRSREVKLDTLVEDADEGRGTPLPRL